MVLVEGENADGVTIDQDSVEISPDGHSAITAAANQVISAILGTREGAAEGGYHLTSTGVTWTDEVEAGALRDALAAHKIENVMLVSAFLAAAALAQAVGNATNYARTALLFIDPDTATLAVVESADGSISDVRRLSLPDDDEAITELTKLASGAEKLDVDGLFVVGSGVDIPLIKPALGAATSLTVSTPEEPDMALARGAALASADAPLFASSTAALAYAQDPGTGVVKPYAVSPGYLAVSEVRAGADRGEQALAYSAVPDEEAAAYTQHRSAAYADDDAMPVEQPSRTPFLVAMSVLVIFVVGVVALAVSLAFTIRPHVAARPNLSQHVVAPTKQKPPRPAQMPSPSAPSAPSAPPVAAPSPAPPTPAHAPAPAPPPAPAPAPPAPAKAPPPAPKAAPPPAPAPAPPAPPKAAPPPAPAPAPPAPPIPPILPALGQALAPALQGPPIQPRGGDHGGGGWGHASGDGRGGGYDGHGDSGRGHGHGDGPGRGHGGGDGPGRGHGGGDGPGRGHGAPSIQIPLGVPGLHLGIGF
jgi:hypothetical protein